MKEYRRKSSKSISISAFIIIFVALSFLSSIIIGKLIQTSITYSLENPYHFEKVLAEIVRIEKVESAHNWNDYYIRYAQYVDAETGVVYEALIPGNVYDEAEAQSYVGKTTEILIDREYHGAIAYVPNAKSGGAPIDLIVYSILLVFCLSISVFCIVKITKKNKKHWIWIVIYIILMLGLAAYVAYASFDMNYLAQLKNLPNTNN